MQYHFVQLFTEQLADASRAFSADLQSVLILGIVGQKALHARIQADFHDLGPAPEDRVADVTAGINSTSIAEISGIPRETVRRKLEALAARGWIERDRHGRWTPTMGTEQATARRDLAGLDQRQIDRVARFLTNTHHVVAGAVAARLPDGAVTDPAARDD